ncbi:hypothetical protein EB796_005839 [Bugula neritina]|uniref:Uncharacterized protein n=1 Tax=Bugula neritina TaxID=10212 RepID=A0A7J7KB26_BUGNE|nr:hypothetical protein EB796_005839 [Bugula neritina]
MHMMMNMGNTKDILHLMTKLSSYKISQTIIVADHVGSQPTIKETNGDPLELQDLLGHKKLHKSNKTYGASTQATPVLEEVVNVEHRQSGAKRIIKVSAAGGP